MTLFFGFALEAYNHQHPEEWFATLLLRFLATYKTLMGQIYIVFSLNVSFEQVVSYKNTLFGLSGAAMSASKLEKTVVNLERRLREVHVTGMLSKCSRLDLQPIRVS